MILRPYTWPGDLTMTLIGGKWKPLIIYHLLKREAHRFNGLKHMMPGISAKMLVKHLRELELDGLARRWTDEKGHILYSSTDRSQALAPVLDAMYQWALGNGSSYGDPAASHAYPGFDANAPGLFLKGPTREIQRPQVEREAGVLVNTNQ